MQSVDFLVPDPSKSIAQALLEEDPNGDRFFICMTCTSQLIAFHNDMNILSSHHRVIPAETEDDPEDAKVLEAHHRISMTRLIPHSQDQYKLWQYYTRLTDSNQQTLTILYRQMAMLASQGQNDKLRFGAKFAETDYHLVRDCVPVKDVSIMIDPSTRPLFPEEIEEEVMALRHAHYFPFEVCVGVDFWGHPITEMILEQEWYVAVLTMAGRAGDLSLVKTWITSVNDHKHV
jgi:hypothetical protein